MVMGFSVGVACGLQDNTGIVRPGQPRPGFRHRFGSRMLGRTIPTGKLFARIFREGGTPTAVSSEAAITCGKLHA